MEDKFIPKDNEYYRKIYEPKGKGICGISVLAVLLKKSCREILEEIGDYKGYIGFRVLRKFLEKNNFKFKQKKGNCSKSIYITPNRKLICRVQWVGKDKGKYHGYTSWREATCNTHYIIIEDDFVFCNAEGWFEIKFLKKYLEEGYITSYLEVENGN